MKKITISYLFVGGVTIRGLVRQGKIPTEVGDEISQLFHRCSEIIASDAYSKEGLSTDYQQFCKYLLQYPILDEQLTDIRLEFKEELHYHS